MGKYNQFRQNQSFQDRENARKAPPVWRGIGFILMIGIPFLAYVLSLVLLEQNAQQGWISIPREYLARGVDSLLYIKIGLTLLLSLLLFAIFSFLGVLMFQVGGHQRYGPLDAPPEHRRPRGRNR